MKLVIPFQVVGKGGTEAITGLSRQQRVDAKSTVSVPSAPQH